MFRVLSTKKLQPETVAAIRQHGMILTEQEFISTRPLPFESIHEKILRLSAVSVDHLVFTSAHAVSALELYARDTGSLSFSNSNLFCLSGKTKQAVLRATHIGKKIIGEANNAGALAAEIIRQQVKEVIFFCGNRRRNELPDALQVARTVIHEVVLYETVETPHASGDMDAVLFFSPSAVESFFSVNQLKESTICFAIGDTTADAIRAHSNNHILTSDLPGEESMINCLHHYFQNKNDNK